MSGKFTSLTEKSVGENYMLGKVCYFTLCKRLGNNNFFSGAKIAAPTQDVLILFSLL
jgi:hypothetical protein